jgi:predicted peptidase
MNSGPQITLRAFIQTTAAAAIAAPLRAASTVIPSRSPAPMHAPGGCDARGQKRFPIGLSYRQSLQCVVAIVLCFGIASSPHAQAADKQQKLESLLRRFPDADANKDGKLTVEEAKAYNAAHPELRQKRQADGKGKADEADEGTVSAQVLALYEAREFKGVPYRLLKPIDLAKNPDQKYPLILSLHGAGGIGNDNVRNLREWCMTRAQEELRRKHPSFVVAPQTFGFWRTPAMTPHYTDENISKLSADWQAIISGHRKRLQNPQGANLDRVFLLLDALAKEFPIETNRVYVLGHSGGGFGTWTAVAEQPNRFAAAITSAGWLAPWFDAIAVKDVPIWSFQGAKDKTSQVRLGNATFKRMKAVGANMKFTEVANIGHGVGGVAFRYTGDSTENTGVTKYASDRCDKTADVWDWLFGQKRAAK